ncbi:hypothetical protein [Azospirillum endophyticum]|nr:hypothetical protein [Azospirillum endophyticum]
MAMMRDFHMTFMLSMNHAVVHTGSFPMTLDLPATGRSKRKAAY